MDNDSLDRQQRAVTRETRTERAEEPPSARRTIAERGLKHKVDKRAAHITVPSKRLSAVTQGVRRQTQTRLKCKQDIATAGMENPLADLVSPKLSALESLAQEVPRVLGCKSRHRTGQNVSEHPVLMIESKRGPLGRIDE
jgi:hypothetical protein